MRRFTRLAAIWALVHLASTFALFTLLWMLPSGPGTGGRILGALLEVLLQPFAGPHRWIAAPRGLEVAADGVLLSVLTSVLWGSLLAAVVVLARRRVPRPA